MINISKALKASIRIVPDFPKKGISFKDITPVLLNPELNRQVVETLANQVKDLGIDVVVGIDSRGFLFGNSLAIQLGLPFALVRKTGKLPADVVTETYELEYGTDTLQLHTDAIKIGDRVLIHDDLLATGGTAACAAKLIRNLGGEVVASSFIVELKFLDARSKHNDKLGNIISLTSYDS